EVAGHGLDQPGLDAGPELHGALRHLDAVEADGVGPPHELPHLALDAGQLQQGAADAGAHLGLPAGLDLGPDVAADVGRAPAELDEVDVGAGQVEQRLQRGDGQAPVDDV